MSDATKAVFLSYAREDTDAARRIADALRGDPRFEALRGDPPNQAPLF